MTGELDPAPDAEQRRSLAGRLEDEIEDEFAFHVEMRARELVAAGMDPREARTLAESAFGDTAVLRAQCLDIQRSRRRRGAWKGVWRALGHDARQAFRMLRRRPGFSLIASGTLALGIAATASGFAVVDAALLRGLPYPEADRLVTVWETDPNQPLRDMAPANFVDLSERARGIEEWTAYRALERTLTGPAEAARVLTASVTHRFFQVLGTPPAHGSGFGGLEPGVDPPAAVISHGLWQRAFGADPAVPGRAVELDGTAYIVVGVAPAGLNYPSGTELWTWSPLDLPELAGFTGDLRLLRDARFIQVLARREAGASLASVRAELERVMGVLRSEYPDENRNAGVAVVPLQEHLVASFNSTILLLFGAVALILLIACANVANLMLVRAVERGHELAIRSALGAGRLRLAQHQLAESAVIGLLGGTLGALLAFVSVSAAQRYSAEWFDAPLRLDFRVGLFILLVTALVTVIFGGLPGLIQRFRPPAVLSTRGTASGSLSSALSVRRVMMIGEVTLAFTLVLGAGLAIRSARNLQQVDVGFDAAQLLTMRVSLGPEAQEHPDRSRILGEMIDRLLLLPAVESVTVAGSGPLAVGPSAGLRVEGVDFPTGESPDVGWQFASSQYPQTFGVELVEGRWFTSEDGPDGRPVAAVNATLARQVFGSESPVGRRVNTGIDGRGVWVEVVGVLSDTRNRGPAAPPFPTVYRPLAQASGSSAMIGLRLKEQPDAALINAVTAGVHDVDADAPVYRVQTGSELLAVYTASTRLVVTLLGLFAALALALASVGIYGVTAYAVRSRLRDLGVRVALGATRREIFMNVLSDALRPCLVGLGAGLLLALAAGSVFRGLLFGVSPLDPLNTAAVGLLMLGVAAAASLGPAVRASRLDPVESLRAE